VTLAIAALLLPAAAFTRVLSCWQQCSACIDCRLHSQQCIAHYCLTVHSSAINARCPGHVGVSHLQMGAGSAASCCCWQRRTLLLPAAACTSVLPAAAAAAAFRTLLAAVHCALQCCQLLLPAAAAVTVTAVKCSSRRCCWQAPCHAYVACHTVQMASA
jgi:hypothetical protein